MSLLTLLLLLAGLALLVVGGEALVRGGSGLGRRFGLSPLVVGLTVVAFATSAPELAVSLDASLSGAPGLAVGNVVGSNITNVLLVLGLASLVLPVVARAQLVHTDVPVMLGFSLLLLVLALDGGISRLDGLLLVLLLAAYLVRSVRTGRKEGAGPEPAGEEPPPRLLRDVALVVVGVALLVLGARLLVSAAREIAEAAGVSDLVIGLTVVAIGTSLPELATSVIAALRGEREMAIGNVVGSNVFNIGAVMGLTAGLSPGGVPVDPAAVRLDIPVMVAAALALLPIVFTGAAVARWEGGLFVAYYGAYVAYLLLAATDHDALTGFGTVTLGFVLPLTALTLVVLAVYELGVRRGRRAQAREDGEGPGPG